MGIAFGVEWGNRSSPGPHYVFSLDELLPGDHVVVFTPTKEGKPRDEQPRLWAYVKEVRADGVVALSPFASERLRDLFPTVWTIDRKERKVVGPIRERHYGGITRYCS